MSNKKIKVGYQGVSGAYHEVAATKFFPEYLSHKNYELVSFDLFEHIYEALEKNEIDYGIVGIENSLAGSIHKNFDLLAKYNFDIIGEVYIHVAHQLLGLKNAKLKDIKEIYSQLPALMQTQITLQNLLPSARRIEYFDTAASARMVAEKNDKTLAAVASVRAGEVYGLKVLKKNIQDDNQNYTRFVIIRNPKTKEINKDQFTKRKSKEIEKYKTSIVFTGDGKQVGFLFKCLACFSLRNINLTKIESRPIPKTPWNYYFYIDIEGDLENQNIKNAINNLQELCTFVKILGSYKAGKL
jgi:prephenate dehydratase